MKLSQIHRFALSLPAVTEEPHFAMSSFRVRGKIFATVPPEGDRVHIFIDEDQREVALATHPEFLEKLFWGRRVVGLKVTLANAKAPVVTHLLKQAWSRRAPKALLP